MPSLTLKWITDGNPCPLCAPLEGYEWTYIAGVHKIPSRLSAMGRFVWDLAANHSLAHGLHRYNCACVLELSTSLSDVVHFALMLKGGLTS